MPTSSAITRTKNFLRNNREKLEKELKLLDEKILKLQTEKATISTFLKMQFNIEGPAQPTEEVTRTYKSKEDKVTPLSVHGLKIGLALSNFPDFNIDDLYKLVNLQDKTIEKDYLRNWIAAWKAKSWIETLGFNRYKIKEAFVIAANESLKNSD